MEIINNYENISKVADRFKISIDDLIHSAVNGYIDIATYIDFDKITHIEPYPNDTVNVPKFNSGIYFISNRDIIKFHFNSGENSIIINNIYPNEVSALNEDFPSPYADDDISSYPEMHWMGEGDRPLLCLIINDYSVGIKNLVIPSYCIEMIGNLSRNQVHSNISENPSLATIATDHECQRSYPIADEKTLAEKGFKFSQGNKGSRSDNLWKALSCVVDSYRDENPATGKLPLHDIIKKMKKLKETNDTVRKIITDIEDVDYGGKIWWLRQNGNPKGTKFEGIDKRLTFFRRKFSSDV